MNDSIFKNNKMTAKYLSWVHTVCTAQALKFKQFLLPAYRLLLSLISIRFEKMGGGTLLKVVLFCSYFTGKSINCSVQKDTFTEELFIKPLPTGHLYSFFQFTTKWDVDPEQTVCKQLYLKSSINSISSSS